jgi:hypothetical protein
MSPEYRRVWRRLFAVCPSPQGAFMRLLPTLLAIGTTLVVLATAAAAPQPDAEKPFLAENDAAMVRMMADMHVAPTGDVDHDFAAMMIPHHQGAIDMATAYLRVGRNEQLRRIAQEIVIGQQQEISAMRLALGQPLPPSTAAVTDPHREH